MYVCCIVMYVYIYLYMCVFSYMYRFFGCSCEALGNTKLFLTCLEGEKKLLVIFYSPSPTEIEFSLLTRGRNVCCAQLFSSYHCSLQPPPYLSSCTLWGLQLSGKGMALLLSFTPTAPTFLLKGRFWAPVESFIQLFDNNTKPTYRIE